ncbi:MAG: peptidase M15, partial [Clostridiales bacterium]|nr:peptidase M15 [Clostridiales bacterium]
EEKRSKTGIEYEPWHFRYIGKPHSYIATEYNMCLEEYVDYLKEFQFGEKHLRVRDGDGKRYEIYYTDKLDVPVPSGKQYKVSGNNVDGFIITVMND